MGEAAVMSEAEYWAFEAIEHVKIGRFGGQSHGCGREGGLAIESRSRQTRAGQEMCDGLQVNFVTQTELRPPYVDGGRSEGWFLGTSTVSASGNMDRVIGKRPSNSPSAST